MTTRSRRDAARLHSNQYVFFDAAGTLFDVRGSVGEIYARIAARHGAQSEASEINAAFGRAFRARTVQGIGSPDPADLTSAERRWWFDVVSAVFGARMSPAVLRDYFDEVFEFFRSAEAWVLFPETLQALERLSSSGRRLGIISNFDSRLLDLLGNLGIDGFFDNVTVSWAAGAAKPDRRIFEAALQQADIEPDEAVHVGDSLSEDFEGARGAGLDAILLRRDGACGGAVPCAANLLEVCRLLLE